MKEQKPQSSEKISYKYLNLITPEVAENFGYEVESPVFVSPQLERRYKCPHCNVLYGHLIYQCGETIRSEHWHDNKGYMEGGIYYIHELRAQMLPFPWIATLQPLGERTLGLNRRAEEVLITGILPNCFFGRIDKTDCQINDGFVVEGYDMLIPVCSLDLHPDLAAEPKFMYKIEDGQVLFSQI